MQLPNEIWYIIFKMRTRMIVAEHYARWCYVNEGFNKKISNTIQPILYTNVENVPRYISSFRSWYRTPISCYHSEMGLELVWNSNEMLIWLSRDGWYSDVFACKGGSIYKWEW